MSGEARRADPVRAAALPASVHLPTVPWAIGFLPLLYLGRPGSVQLSHPGQGGRR